MTTVAPTDRMEALERKIDVLSEHVAFLAEDAATRRRQREQFDELLADVTPLAGEAMAVATNRLQELQHRGELGNLVHLLSRLVEVAPTLDRMLAMLDSLSELSADAMPLTNDAMALASERLADLQHRGYFEFARAGFGIVDEVVTNFTEDDVRQLGDNVVTMLNTIKELTQPEMLGMLRHMIDGLQRQQRALRDEPLAAPSLWALAKKMRDPDVRKGIDRALNTLGAVSAETGPETLYETINTPNQRGEA